MPTDIWKFDDAIKLLGKRRQLVIHPPSPWFLERCHRMDADSTKVLRR